jgi:hypothetical protein
MAATLWVNLAWPTHSAPPFPLIFYGKFALTLRSVYQEHISCINGEVIVR